MANSDDLLRSIDSKLTALLALVLDGYLRETGIAQPKDRTIDRMLTDAGLSARQVAGLLGKTDRAVHISLQREREKKAARKKPKKSTREEAA
jgi:IS30 family transposase